MLFMTVNCDREAEQRRYAETDDDIGLARAAAGGDRQSFECLVDKYERFVYRTVYHTVGNAADAEDLTQEIFLKLWRGLPEFCGNARFSTWLMRIVRNTCADHIRKQRRSVTAEPLVFPQEDDGGSTDRELPDPDPQNDPLSAVDRKENIRLVRRAMNMLSEEHRELIILRDIEGSSYERIASVLGLDMGTVKSRLFRARAQLRRVLESLGMFDET